jgi:putative hydrolase of the HAD superfamily
VLDRVPTYAGVRDLLTWLRDQGIRTAAMSDFPVSRKLDRIGLSGLWDAAFSSEETGYLKPNPEPFRRLLDELATEPQHLLYVGNSYRYDIEGARALGIRTAHLGGKPQKPRNADVAFRRFSELRAWLADKIEPTTSSHD